MQEVLDVEAQENETSDERLDLILSEEACRQAILDLVERTTSIGYASQFLAVTEDDIIKNAWVHGVWNEVSRACGCLYYYQDIETTYVHLKEGDKSVRYVADVSSSNELLGYTIPVEGGEDIYVAWGSFAGTEKPKIRTVSRVRRHVAGPEDYVWDVQKTLSLVCASLWEICRRSAKKHMLYESFLTCYSKAVGSRFIRLGQDLFAQNTREDFAQQIDRTKQLAKNMKTKSVNRKLVKPELTLQLPEEYR